MAEKTDLIDSLIYGVDLKNRRLYFGVGLDWTQEAPGDFSQASVEMAIRAMHKMSLDAPGKPIEIHMNSYGGDTYAMLRLHDEILACPCQVKFFGGGAVMSSATWIMAVCDERWLYPNATVMIHELSGGAEGKHTDVRIDGKENTRLMDILTDIYATNTRMPKEFWEDVCQRDLYLSASEAVSLGLADKIVEPKKRGNLRKMRQAQLKKTPDGMRKLVNSVYERLDRKKVPNLIINEPVKEPNDSHLTVIPLETTVATPEAPVQPQEVKEEIKTTD